MAGVLKRWRGPLVWAAIAAGGALGTLLVMAALLLATLDGAPGRWLVHSVIDGYEIDGLGRVSVEGLEGAVTRDVRIRRLSLADADGEWIVVENLHLSWKGWSLRDRILDVSALSAQHVALARLPEGNGAESGATGEFPLDQLHVRTLTVSELAWQNMPQIEAGRIRLRGHLSHIRGGDWLSDIEIAELGRGADHLSAGLRLGAQGVIEGQVEALGERGGVLASLTQLDADRIVLDGVISGDFEGGEGEIRLVADGMSTARGALDWDERRWRFNGHADLTVWPGHLSSLFPEPRMRAGGLVEDYSLRWLDLDADRVSLRLRQAVSGWIYDFRAEPDWLADVLPAGVSAGELRATGQLASLRARELRGRVRLNALAHERVRLERVAGQFDLVWRDTLRLNADLSGQGTDWSDARLQDLTGAAPRLGLSISRAMDAPEVRVERLSVRLPSLEAQATGSYDLDLGSLVGAAEITVDDLSHLPELKTAGLTGSAVLRLETADTDQVDLDLSLLALELETLPQLGARDIQVSARAHGSADAWQVESVHVRGEGLDIQGQVSSGAAGAVEVRGEMALDLAQGFEVAGLSATEFVANIQPDGQIALQAVSEVSDLVAFDQNAARSRIGLDLSGQGPLWQGRWQIESALAGYDAYPLAGVGTLSLGPQDHQVEIEQFDLGPDIQARGAIISSADDVAVTLDWESTQGWQARTHLSHPQASDDLDAVQVDARLRWPDFVAGPASFTQAQIELAGLLSDARLSGQLTGTLGAQTLSLDLDGMAALHDGELEAQWRVDGQFGEHSVVSPQSWSMHAGAAGAQLEAALDIADSALSLILARSEAPSLSMSARAISAELAADLTGWPLEGGVFNGQADLGFVDGRWQGEARWTGENLSADRRLSLPDVDLSLSLVVADEIQGAARIGSEDLVASVDLLHPGPVHRLDQIWDPDLSWRGRAVLDGQIASLTALFLPGTVQLAGELDGQMQFEGSRSDPDIQGGLTVSDGFFDIRSSGLHVEDLATHLELDGSRLRLVSFSGHDGQGGTMDLNGEIDLAGGHVAGQLDAVLTGFHAVEQDDVSAQTSGTAQMAWSEDGVSVTGDINIDSMRVRPPEARGPVIVQLDVVELNRPEDLQPALSLAVPVELDLKITGKDSIVFTMLGLNSYWSADLHLGGRLADPDLTGSATLDDGALILFSRRFVLQNGSVGLSGDLDQASLNIHARHERNGFSADIWIGGTVEQPTFSLSSSPSMPEDEILAYLLFDRSATDLSPVEAAQLAAQLSGVSLFDVTSRLRQMAGFERLDVSASEDGAVQVTTGHRLTEDVYVELEAQSASQLATARVEWSLTPDLSILSRLSNDTNASIGVRWRRDY